MKICLINNLYKPYARGGAEKIVEITAEEFLKQGHEVVVISTKPDQLRIMNHELRIKNGMSNYLIPSLYFKLNKISSGLRFFWHIFDMFDFGSFFVVRGILKKEKADLVITHNLKGVGYLIPLAIKSLSLKHFHALHDIQLLHPSGLMIYGKEKKIDNLSARIYSFFCHLLFGSPAVIISPSKWLLDEHIKRGFFKNSKQQILPNPVNSEIMTVFKESRERKTEAVDKHFFRFLYVGQIEAHKGIIFLIKAFKNLTHKDCELILAGDGTKMEEIKNLTKSLNNIKILGRKNSKEIKELMLSSDCLIVPSLCYENSPTVIYEAIASGLPAIASNIGGIPELINNPKLLFSPNNESDLIACLKSAIEEIESQADLYLKNKKIEINPSQYIKTILDLMSRKN